jgi:PIN domain nuclease of toxin-antitoxin system
MVKSPSAISVISIWEVDLKHRLGKLPIAPARFRDEMPSAGATFCGIHRDLFDRLLVSLAEAENRFSSQQTPRSSHLGVRNLVFPSGARNSSSHRAPTETAAL